MSTDLLNTVWGGGEEWYTISRIHRPVSESNFHGASQQLGAANDPERKEKPDLLWKDHS